MIVLRFFGWRLGGTVLGSAQRIALHHASALSAPANFLRIEFLFRHDSARGRRKNRLLLCPGLGGFGFLLGGFALGFGGLCISFFNRGHDMHDFPFADFAAVGLRLAIRSGMVTS